jgi:hypothetical protein
VFCYQFVATPVFYLPNDSHPTSSVIRIINLIPLNVIAVMLIAFRGKIKSISNVCGYACIH